MIDWRRGVSLPKSICAFCYMWNLCGVVVFHGSMVGWRRGWGQSVMKLIWCSSLPDIHAQLWGVGLPANLPILNTLDISCFASQKVFCMIYKRPKKRITCIGCETRCYNFLFFTSNWCCHMIKSFRLDLRSAPTNRLVDESSSISWYIYIGSHISLAHVIWVSKSQHHVDMF